MLYLESRNSHKYPSLIFAGWEYEVFNPEKNDPHILSSFTSTTQAFQLCNTIMRPG